MSGRLSDEDVERIAGRVVSKLVKIALVVVLGFWLVPVALFGGLAAVAFLVRDLPSPVGVALTSAVLAVPLIALILVWSRQRSRT